MFQRPSQMNTDTSMHRRPFWHSLKFRLSVLMMAICTLGLWSLSFYVADVVQEHITATASNQQHNVTRLHADTINQELLLRLDAMDRVAESFDLGMLGDRSALQSTLRNRPLMPLLFNGGYFVTDIGGVATASVPESAGRVGVSFLDRDHVHHALTQNSRKISKPALDKRLGVPVVSFATPIRGKDGLPVGAMVGVVDLSKANFLDAVLNAPFGVNGRYTLVSHDWQMVVSSTSKALSLTQMQQFDVKGELKPLLEGGVTSALVRQRDGELMLVSAHSIPVANWMLLSAVPYSEVIQPMEHIRRVLVGVTLLASVLFGALTLWALHWQLTPITDTVRRLSRLASGHEPLQLLPQARRDEVGQLIAAFNALLEVLLKREADLTASQRSLVELTGRLELAQEVARLGNWSFELETGKVVWSRQMFDMFQLQADSFVPTQGLFMAAVHREDRAAVQAVFDAALQGGGAHQVQHRIVLQNGQVKWLQQRGHVEFDAHGKPVRMVGTVLDITEYKHLSDELTIHRNQLEQLVAQRTQALALAESLSDQALELAKAGHWHIDLSQDSETYISSPRTMAIFGDPPHADLRYSIRQHWYEAIAAADPVAAELVLQNYLDALAGKVPAYDATHPYRRPADGRVIWVHVMGRVQRDSDGHPVQVHGVVMDVTDGRMVEESLRQAALAADAASRSKSEFLANMSHEIRTPLNAISGMARLIGQGTLSVEQRDRLTKLTLSGDHLLRIINDILDMSKIEAGKFELQVAQVRLQDVVDSVVTMLSDRALAKRLRLQGAAASIPGGLLGDQTRLVQALLNLAGNAVKFTEAGTVSIHASLEDETPVSVLVRFEVQDTGIGIASGALSRLFQSFEQIHQGRTRAYGGTGLGLAITRRIAELMGGTVGVESQEGVGSRFWFTARLQRSADLQTVSTDVLGGASPSVEALATDWEQVLKAEFPHRQVLVVEDDAFNQEIALMLMEEVEQEVSLADDGRFALNMASERVYDLILMDMQMPHMDGLETTRRIRQLASYSHVPIVALTGNAFDENRAQCLEAGMNDFVTKPIDPQRLYRAMVEQWRRRA